MGTAEFFAATMDIWSSSTMEPYLSYTLHCIPEDWQLKNYCLETLYLPQNHTGANIAEALESIVESWGLKSEQQICNPNRQRIKHGCCHYKIGMDSPLLFWP